VKDVGQLLTEKRDFVRGQFQAGEGSDLAHVRVGERRGHYEQDASMDGALHRAGSRPV
jgi:hypothetical protein